MPIVIACLRGVNVGGNRLIKMDVLRRLVTGCGATDVATYIQSGNVVCRTATLDLAAWSQAVEEAIERELGFRPPVISRSRDHFNRIIASNPFPLQAEAAPQKLYVTLLPEAPSAAAIEQALAAVTGPESIRLAGAEIYTYFPEGMGKSKMPWGKLDRILGAGTARNWNSILELGRLADGLARGDQGAG